MNDLITTRPVDLDVARAPKIILDEAKIAALALRDVISKKDNPVKFNNEQYLEFEDWQTIGKFYGLACSTLKPSEVMVDGVVGAEAQAEVIDVKTGRIVGRASAWCLRDEPNWRNKPLYQLGSMAQTRAGSKALRNLLSWVVVLAGYRTTPAEEMQAEITKGEMKNDAIEPVGLPSLKRNPDGDRYSNLVHDILDKLVALHQGNQDEVEEHLKFITKYTSKDGQEKWLSVSDLEGVAQHKPEWIERIHRKVALTYAKSKAQ